MPARSIGRVAVVANGNEDVPVNPGETLQVYVSAATTFSWLDNDGSNVDNFWSTAGADFTRNPITVPGGGTRKLRLAAGAAPVNARIAVLYKSN